MSAMTDTRGDFLERRLVWLDVFTQKALSGNPLPVLFGSDPIDDLTLLHLTREWRQSEASFIKRATKQGADYLNDTFMPRKGRIPFAGHPSLGGAVAVAYVNGEQCVEYVQQTGAGLQPVRVKLNDRTAYASMLQEPAVFRDRPDPERVFKALGLTAQDAHPEWPVQVVSTGIDHLMVPVRDRAALDRADPSQELLAAITAETETTVLYPFVLGESPEEAVARSFFPGLVDVTEDPATGSAAGPLGAFLWKYNNRTERLVISQGEHVDRPSRIDTQVEGDLVRVGGHCVIVSDGKLLI
jgi:trans-2,3-dihydro-3-hydroxyanthranilate isomerase